MEIVVIPESQYIQNKNFRQLDEQAKSLETREHSVSSMEVKVSMTESIKTGSHGERIWIDRTYNAKGDSWILF